MIVARVQVRRFVGLLASAVAALALVASPAGAASRTVNDAAGDAARALDITSVRYTNNDASVVFTWHLRRVTASTRLTGTTLDTCGGSCSDYYQYRVGKFGGAPKVHVYKGLASGGLKKRACGGARVTWQPPRHLVRARVPRSCMVGPAKLFMQSWSAKTWTGRAVDITRGRDVVRG